MSANLPVVVAPKRTGRPSSYTDAVALEICVRLAEGESLRTICESAHIPTVGTVLKWVFTNEGGFLQQYTRARAMQAELRADEIIDIADRPQIGIVRTMGPKGLEVREGDMLEHRKLQIEARKWVAAKLLPKKYGVQPEPLEGDKDAPSVIVKGGLQD